MSKTYRRKFENLPYWMKQESIEILGEPRQSYYSNKIITPVIGRLPKPRDLTTKEAKRDIALYHSDARKWRNGQWPGWALNLYVQKPYRIEVRRQLSNFKKDKDYEVTLRSKPKKSYW